MAVSQGVQTEGAGQFYFRVPAVPLSAPEHAVGAAEGEAKAKAPRGRKKKAEASEEGAAQAVHGAGEASEATGAVKQRKPRTARPAKAKGSTAATGASAGAVPGMAASSFVVAPVDIPAELLPEAEAVQRSLAAGQQPESISAQLTAYIQHATFSLRQMHGLQSAYAVPRGWDIPKATALLYPQETMRYDIAMRTQIGLQQQLLQDQQALAESQLLARQRQLFLQQAQAQAQAQAQGQAQGQGAGAEGQIPTALAATAPATAPAIGPGPLPLPMLQRMMVPPPLPSMPLAAEGALQPPFPVQLSPEQMRQLQQQQELIMLQQQDLMMLQQQALQQRIIQQQAVEAAVEAAAVQGAEREQMEPSESGIPARSPVVQEPAEPEEAEADVLSRAAYEQQLQQPAGMSPGMGAVPPAAAEATPAFSPTPPEARFIPGEEGEEAGRAGGGMAPGGTPFTQYTRPQNATKAATEGPASLEGFGGYGYGVQQGSGEQSEQRQEGVEGRTTGA
jgi:hypothetical protein